MKATRVTGYGLVFHGVFDRVIGAAGSSSSITQACQAVRPRGVIVLVAAPATLAGVDPTPLWYRDVTCRGVYVYGPVPWEEQWVHPYSVLLPRLESGELQLKDLLTHEYTLSSHGTALGAAVRQRGSGAIKVAFRIAGTP
jgi:threonine dehydrogenase-like Zn-dependent dehydrogenase